jgi:chorismate synthase
MLRFLTAGESHGQALVVIVEGLPAGIKFGYQELENELARRRLGYGRGPRMRIEKDEVKILSGIRHGYTLGSPIAIEISNTEWPKWAKEMSVEQNVPQRLLTEPRPGHADLVGMLKYGFDDARNVLERASARETAARVAAGSLIKSFLSEFEIKIISHVIQLGKVRASLKTLPKPEDLDEIDNSAVRCFDKTAEQKMIQEIKQAAKDGDSLGGVVQVIAYNVPVGLGSYVHWDRKLDAMLAYAMMSIQAIKGVEIGDGFALAKKRGSVAHDAIYFKDARFFRKTYHSGGIEGGISTGEPILVNVAMKPLSTLNKPTIKTVDFKTKRQSVSFKERTDVTAVPAMGVVAESMASYVIAKELLRKTGGDSLKEVKANLETHIANMMKLINS